MRLVWYGRDKNLRTLSLPGLFNAACFPQSSIMKQLHQLLQCNWLWKEIGSRADPWWAGLQSSLRFHLTFLQSFPSLGQLVIIIIWVGDVLSFISTVCPWFWSCRIHGQSRVSALKLKSTVHHSNRVNVITVWFVPLVTFFRDPRNRYITWVCSFTFKVYTSKNLDSSYLVN